MIKTIDEYINSVPKEERKALEELRGIILSVHGFEETVAYGMPAFRYKGKIVACFRNHMNHIGFYPYSGTVLKKFPAELKKFKTSVGGVQLPKGKRLPRALIKRIVRARMREIEG